VLFRSRTVGSKGGNRGFSAILLVGDAKNLRMKMKNIYFKILAIFVLLFAIQPVAEAVNQYNTTLVRTYIRNSTDTVWSQANYGELSTMYSEAFVLTTSHEAIGGFYSIALSTGWIEDNVTGFVTTIIPGDGLDSDSDPTTPTVSVDVTELVGLGITNSGNDFTVDLGTGMGLDFNGNDVSVTPGEIDVTQLLNYQAWLVTVATTGPITGNGTAGTPLDISADGIKDTHIDWGTGATSVSGGDLPLVVTNFNGVLRAGDNTAQLAFDYIDDLTLADWGTYTLDSLYDESASKVITIDEGAIEYEATTAGGATNFNTYTFDGNLTWEMKTAGSVIDHLGFTSYGDLEVGNSVVQSEIIQNDGDGETLTSRTNDLTASVIVDYSNYGSIWGSGHLVSLVSGGAGILVATAVNPATITPDTDTDNEQITMSTAVLTTVPAAPSAAITLGYIIPIVATGTINRADIYITTWTVNQGADTVTFSLYYDGGAVDTWTTNAGAVGVSDSGANVSYAVTVGHYVEIFGQITASGLPDIIKTNCWSLNNQIK